MWLIRKALPSDALGITIVNVYTWKTTYSGLISDSAIDARIAGLRGRATKCRNDIEKSDNCLVAVDEGMIVGFCCYGVSRNDAYQNAGEIYAIYVLKGYEGNGIGGALFSESQKELLNLGYHSFIVNCLRGNPSLRFYEHMGGKIVGVRQDEILDTEICEDIILFDIV